MPYKSHMVCQCQPIDAAHVWVCSSWCHIMPPQHQLRHPTDSLPAALLCVTGAGVGAAVSGALQDKALEALRQGFGDPWGVGMCVEAGEQMAHRWIGRVAHKIHQA